MALVERFISPTGAGAHDGLAEGSAWDLPEALTNLVASQRGNAIKGNYVRTTVVDKPSNAGTASGPIIIRGYKSDIGDLDNLARSNDGTGELVTVDFPNFDYTAGRMESTARMIWQNLHITSENIVASKAALVIDGVNVFVESCKVHNDKGGADSNERAIRGNQNDLTIINSDFQSDGSDAGGLQAVQFIGSGVFQSSRIKTLNGGNAQLRCIGIVIVDGAVFWGGNSGTGISITSAIDFMLTNSTFYNFSVDALDKSAVGQMTTVKDCVAWKVGRFIDLNASDLFAANNAAGLIATARLTGTGDWPEINLITLGSIPFVDADNGDFRLNGTSDGGALCRAEGSFSNDLGAIQYPRINVITKRRRML